MRYPDIDPIIFSLSALDTPLGTIGPLAVHWYGVMYLIGFVAGWWLGRRRLARSGSGWNDLRMDDLLFYVAMGVILGGRLGYILFYSFGDWLRDPLVLIRIWDGGMSFHGGFIGVLVAMWLYARKIGRTFFELADFVAPLVPLGLLAGRIGNFINGELWGRPTDLPWAMELSCRDFVHLCRDKLQLPAGSEWTPPLHPTQLYEAGLEGLALFLLLWFYSARPRPRMAISALFLIGYGMARFSVEFVRMPDAHIGYLAGNWFTMGQLLTLPMILIGTGMLLYAYRRNHETVS